MRIRNAKKHFFNQPGIVELFICQTKTKGASIPLRIYDCRIELANESTYYSALAKQRWPQPMTMFGTNLLRDSIVCRPDKPSLC
jgi:hypothetical protein